MWEKGEERGVYVSRGAADAPVPGLVRRSMDVASGAESEPVPVIVESNLIGSRYR